MLFRSKVSLLAGAVALSAIGSMASAHSIQIFAAPTTSPAGGGNTNYSYIVQVTANNQVNSGDFFTLVDMTGYVGVVSTPAGWSLYNSAGLATTPSGPASTLGSVTLIQTQAGTVGVNDSSSTPDLTFQYTGPTLGGNPTNTILGTFVITSTKSMFNLTGSTIVGSDHQSGTNIAGQNSDPYITPGDSALPVPLPAAAWGGMSLLGALGAGKLVRRRK